MASWPREPLSRVIRTPNGEPRTAQFPGQVPWEPPGTLLIALRVRAVLGLTARTRRPARPYRSERRLRQSPRSDQSPALDHFEMRSVAPSARWSKTIGRTDGPEGCEHSNDVRDDQAHPNGHCNSGRVRSEKDVDEDSAAGGRCHQTERQPRPGPLNEVSEVVAGPDETAGRIVFDALPTLREPLHNV